MLYSSANNPKIKELAKLKIKKYRDKQNLFLIEGNHLVKEAYNSGYLKELLLLRKSNLKFRYQNKLHNRKRFKNFKWSWNSHRYYWNMWKKSHDFKRY